MSLTIDITRFHLMMDDLARSIDAPMTEVLRGEVGSILKAWAGYTKVAKPDISERRARKAATHNMRRIIYGAAKSAKVKPGESYVNWGQRGNPKLGVGGIWWRARNSKTGQAVFVPIREGGDGIPWSRRGRKAWPRGVQNAAAFYSSELKDQMRAAKGAAGLARQSVVQIADAVGIKLEDVKGGGIQAAGIRKARAAIAATGKYYQNGQGVQYENAKGTTIEILNGLPYCRKAKMDKGLERAIVGRTKFFEQNMARGVFNTASSVAQKYPNIKVSYGST